MESVYIVTKEGVYRHEVVGVYLTKQEAQDRAVEAIKTEKEKDHYHNFAVMLCSVGKAIDDGISLFYVSQDNSGTHIKDGNGRL